LVNLVDIKKAAGVYNYFDTPAALFSNYLGYSGTLF